MLILKITQDSSISFFPAKNVIVARKGSKAWDRAFAYAKERGVEASGYFVRYPEPLDDNEGGYIDALDETIVEAKGKDANKCIAIVIEERIRTTFPQSLEEVGLSYLFLYEGGELNVLDSNGTTLEIVK